MRANLILRGGDDRASVYKGKAAAKGPRRGALNKRGSWNINGQWGVGGRKIKYLATPDGFDLSRAKMRRQKRKWNDKYRAPSATPVPDPWDASSETSRTGEGEGVAAARSIQDKETRRDEARVDELDIFAPEGLGEKMKTRDRRHMEAALRKRQHDDFSTGVDEVSTKRGRPRVQIAGDSDSSRQEEEAGKAMGVQSEQDVRFGEEKWRWPDEESPLDHLDRLAVQQLERAKDKFQVRVLEVSRAGSSQVNGRYLADTSGDFDHLGMAFRRSLDPASPLFDQVLLFEEGGSVRSQDSHEIVKDRCLLFNDARGVTGDAPYYEAVSNFRACLHDAEGSGVGASPWRARVGKEPCPVVRRAHAVEDEEAEGASGRVGDDDSADDDGLVLPPALQSEPGNGSGSGCVNDKAGRKGPFDRIEGVEGKGRGQTVASSGKSKEALLAEIIQRARIDEEGEDSAGGSQGATGSADDVGSDSVGGVSADDDEEEEAGEDRGGGLQARKMSLIQQARQAGLRVSLHGHDGAAEDNEVSVPGGSGGGREENHGAEDPWEQLASFAKKQIVEEEQGGGMLDEADMVDELLEEEMVGGGIDLNACRSLTALAEQEIEADVHDKRGFAWRDDAGLEDDVGFVESSSKAGQGRKKGVGVGAEVRAGIGRAGREAEDNAGEEVMTDEERRHQIYLQRKKSVAAGGDKSKPSWLQDGAEGLLGGVDVGDRVGDGGRGIAHETVVGAPLLRVDPVVRAGAGEGSMVFGTVSEANGDSDDLWGEDVVGRRGAGEEEVGAVEERGGEVEDVEGGGLLEDVEEEEATTVTEEEEDDIKKERRLQWRLFRQQTDEEREIIEEGVRRGDGYKQIERMLQARQGDFRGLAKQVFEGVNVSAALSRQQAIGFDDDPELMLSNNSWAGGGAASASGLSAGASRGAVVKPLEGVQEVASGRVELARVVRSSKGGSKVQGKRYGSIAAALWHAAQHGGGVLSLDAGEYVESQTLSVCGRTTIRAAFGVPMGSVVVRAPKGRDVVRVDGATSRVLMQNITLIRTRARTEPLPAPHLHVTQWGACVRVSAGVLRLQGCVVRSEKAIGCLAMWDGVLQLVFSTVRECGSDGVVAKDGGVAALNNSLLLRNRHNGVMAEGVGSLARMRACLVQDNAGNGVACVHGATVMATRSSMEMNSGNGAYVCGLPVVTCGRALAMGRTMDPGAVMNISRCNMRDNAENGLVVINRGDVTVIDSRLYKNALSGIGLSHARGYVRASDMCQNGQHGAVADAASFLNVSGCNASHNAEDGIGAFEQHTEVLVSRCLVAHNDWGIAANCKASVTLQKGVMMLNNTQSDKVEVKGGKIYWEVWSFPGKSFPALLDHHRLFRPEDEMSDVSNLESVDRFAFRGQKVKVLTGHFSKKPSRTARRLRIFGRDNAEEWSDITSSVSTMDSSHASNIDSRQLVSASSFAAVDDWQRDPCIEDEKTGRRVRTADDDSNLYVSSSSASDDHGIDETKPFSAQVLPEEGGAQDAGLF